MWSTKISIVNVAVVILIVFSIMMEETGDYFKKHLFVKAKIIHVQLNSQGE